MSRFQVIFDELRNITTIDLAHKAANILEKTLWASIGIVGTIWAFVFIESQFQLWNENPWLTTKADVDLSQLQYPAITFCSDGSTKYAIAERLGNYMNHEVSMNGSQNMSYLKMNLLRKILNIHDFTVMAGKQTYESRCRKERNKYCEVVQVPMILSF